MQQIRLTQFRDALKKRGLPHDDEALNAAMQKYRAERFAWGAEPPPFELVDDRYDNLPPQSTPQAIDKIANVGAEFVRGASSGLSGGALPIEPPSGAPAPSYQEDPIGAGAGTLGQVLGMMAGVKGAHGLVAPGLRSLQAGAFARAAGPAMGPALAATRPAQLGLASVTLGAAGGLHAGMGAALQGRSAGDIARTAGQTAGFMAAMPLATAAVPALGGIPAAGAIGAGVEAAQNPDASVQSVVGTGLAYMLGAGLMGAPYRTRIEPLPGAGGGGARPASPRPQLAGSVEPPKAAQKPGTATPPRAPLSPKAGAPAAARGPSGRLVRPAKNKETLLERLKVEAEAAQQSALAQARPVVPPAAVEPAPVAPAQVAEPVAPPVEVAPAPVVEPEVAALPGPVVAPEPVVAPAPEPTPLPEVAPVAESARIADGTKRVGDTILPRPAPPQKPTRQDDGFTSGMTAIAAAKVNKALGVNMMRDGVPQTRRAIVEDMVGRGYRVVPHAKDGRRLIGPEGSFIEEKRLTKTAMDYAEFLLRSAAPAKPQGDVTLGVGLGGLQSAFDAATKNVTFKQPKDVIVQDSPIDVGAHEARVHLRSGDTWAGVQSWATNNQQKDLSPQLLEDIKTIAAMGKDIPSGAHWVSHPKHWMGAADQGFIDGPMIRHVLLPDGMTQMAMADYEGSWRKIGREATKGMTKKEAVALFDKMQDPNQRGDTDVQLVRRIYDSIHDQVNLARAARGAEPVAYREDYVNHMQEVTLRDKLLGRGDPGLAREGHPDKVFTAFALPRTGKTVNPERDVRVLLDAYISAASRDIFANPVIEHHRKLTAELENAGLPGVAKNLEAYTDYVWAGKRNPFDAAFESMPGGRKLAGVMKFRRRRLTQANLVGSLRWTVGVQPGSTALAVMRYGLRNTAEGAIVAVQPEFVDYLFGETRSGFGKRNTTLGPAGQDHFELTGTAVKPMNKVQAAETAAAYVGKVMEMALSAHAGGAAYVDARKRGLTGTALRSAVNDGVSKVHSDYEKALQPTALQSRVLTSIFPFMSWKMDELNNIGELLGWTGQHRRYSDANPEFPRGADAQSKARWEKGNLARAKRAGFVLKAILAYLGASLVWDEIAWQVVGRRPYSGAITNKFRGRSGYFGGASGMLDPMMPEEALFGLIDAVRSSVENDTVTPLRTWMNRNIITAGSQIENSTAGLEAVMNGGRVYGPTGKLLFRIDEDEYLKAIIFGVKSTREGRKRTEQMGYERALLPWLGDKLGLDDGRRPLRRI